MPGTVSHCKPTVPRTGGGGSSCGFLAGVVVQPLSSALRAEGQGVKPLSAPSFHVSPLLRPPVSSSLPLSIPVHPLESQLGELWAPQILIFPQAVLPGLYQKDSTQNSSMIT